jgi:hypothetical protein
MSRNVFVGKFNGAEVERPTLSRLSCGFLK